MVSLTTLAAIGIGGFVAYKVVGAVAPKISIAMPETGIKIPEALKISIPGIPTPTAEGVKEALSGLTAPLQSAVDTLKETAGKIPAPTDVAGYVDEKISGVKDLFYEQSDEAKQFLIDSRNRVEQIARDAVKAVEEAPGRVIEAGKQKLIVEPLAGAGEILSAPFRAVGFLPEPDQVSQYGAVSFIPFFGAIQKIFG